MTKRKLDNLEDCKDAINDALDQDGPYTHNIIGLVLSKVFKELGGQPAVNELIEEFDLEPKGWTKA